MTEQIKNTDAVFHLTDLGLLASIESQGLQPSEEALPLYSMRRRVDEAVDCYRPQEIIERGISRTDAVFAHPYLDKLNRGSLGAGNMNGPHKQPVALAVEVDPESAIVLDSERLDSIARLMTRRHSGIPVGEMEAYWKTSMPLAEYRKWFDASGRLRADAPSDQPPHNFGRPEVLIPGSIDATRITWVASILTAEQLKATA